MISINLRLLEQTEYDIIIHLIESLKNISGVLPNQTRNAGYIFAILWNGAKAEDDGRDDSRNNSNVVMFSFYVFTF